MEKARKNWLVIGLVVLALAGGYYAWQNLDRNALPAGIASGNGRIEAVEIDISTKTPGRIKEIMVDEGDFVTAGQVLAQMDTVQLEAHKRQAEAQERRAVIGVEAAKNLVTQREAEKAAADAVLAQRRAQLDAAERRLARSEQLVKTSTVSQQVLDDDRRRQRGQELPPVPRKPRSPRRMRRSIRRNPRSSMPKPRSRQPRHRSKASSQTSTTALWSRRVMAASNIVSSSPAKCWRRAAVCSISSISAMST